MDYCTELGKSSICTTGFTSQGYCGTKDFNIYDDIDPAFNYFNGLRMTRSRYNTDNCPLKNSYGASGSCMNSKRVNNRE